MDVQVLLYEGFDELDAVGPFEVFATAARAVEQTAGRTATVSTRTLSPVDRVRGSHGLRVVPDGRLAEPDLLVVPGGGWNDRAEAGAWAEAERGDVPLAVAACHRRGATVAAVCTGTMLLARAGLLDGRPAVTHRGAVADLRATDAEVVEARVVDDGDVVTAGGVTSGLDLALHLVAREFGETVADRVAETVEYERTGEVYRA
ncbi:MAG: DJ-1/PfpI family protein [Haloarculaceae archaeon]